jgi:hypothetical protein
MIWFDRVLSSVHIVRNILFKFNLLDRNDHAQNTDLFLFLTQLRSALIVTRSMIITLVNGYDHYVILSEDCLNTHIVTVFPYLIRTT